MRTLREIAKQHPSLTFQNDGFEYLKKSELSEPDLVAIDEVTEILRRTLPGFVKFFNFKLRKSTGELVVRLDFIWDPDSTCFVGVGYFPLTDLE